MEEAVQQMRAYGHTLFNATQWAPALSPHYAVNILRGYSQMEKENRLPDLSVGETPTDTAYAVFCSPAWDADTFHAEWAQQEARVTA